MPRRRPPPLPEPFHSAAHRGYLIRARTDGRVSIFKDGGYIGTANDVDDAKRIIDDELPRENPVRRTKRQSKTIDVQLPLSEANARAWLKKRLIPFTHMRELSGGGTAFRIRRGYYGDFRHQKDMSAPQYNPVRGAARRSMRVVGRVVRGRRHHIRNSPADAKPVRAFTLDKLRVEFFQGYAEYVYYLREADGKPYKHKVETDAAELYLCTHPEFGNCLLIVDPSGRTPLWK